MDIEYSMYMINIHVKKDRLHKWTVICAHVNILYASLERLFILVLGAKVFCNIKSIDLLDWFYRLKTHLFHCYFPY